MAQLLSQLQDPQPVHVMEQIEDLSDLSEDVFVKLDTRLKMAWMIKIQIQIAKLSLRHNVGRIKRLT